MAEYDFSDFEGPDKEFDFSDFEDEKKKSPSDYDKFRADKQRYDEMALAPIGAVTEFVDKYTGAPIRAGISALQEGKDFEEAAGTALNQFGEDTSGVPNFKDIMAKGGVSTKEYAIPGLIADPTAKGDDRNVKVSAAGVLGGVAEGLTDPTMYLPYGRAAKAYREMSPGLLKHLRVAAGERAAKATVGNSLPRYQKVLGIKSNEASPKMIDAAAEKRGYSLLEDNKQLGTKAPVNSIFTTPKKASAIAGENYEALRRSFSDIKKRVDSSGEKYIDMKDALDDVLADDSFMDIPDSSGGDVLKNRIMEELAILEKEGKVSYERAQAIKDRFKYEKTSSDAFIKNQDMVNKFNRAVDKAMGLGLKRAEQADPNLAGIADKWNKTKELYGPNKAASLTGGGQRTATTARNMFSPSTMAGAGFGSIVGAQLGGPAGAAIGAAAGGVARALGVKYGDAAMARSMFRLSQLAGQNAKFVDKYGKVLEMGAKAGPRGIVMYHNLLMNNDPGYAAYFNEPGDEKAEGK